MQPRQSINRYTRKRAIVSLLVLSLLSLTLFPYHYHLHHVDHPTLNGAPTHLVDSHRHLGLEDAGANDYHAVESGSDVTLKPTGFQLPLFALLLALVMLLPWSAGDRYRSSVATGRPRPSFLPHNTPPLRAPPRS
jgi:hypothetical protein